MASDVRVWTGAAWESLKGQQGPPGPNAVSTDAGNELKLGADSRLFYRSAGAANLDSNSSIWCKPGDNLAAKYAAAKALRPGGLQLSTINRATLVLAPGNYTGQTINVDAEWVDILGLGFARLDRGCRPAVKFADGTSSFNVTANDVCITGIDVRTTGSTNLTIGDNLPLQIWDSCFFSARGGIVSFAHLTPRLAGTFINCESDSGGSANSLPAFGKMSTGRFVNCLVKGSPGFCPEAVGVFINCEVDNASGFGGNPAGNGIASGTFIDCIAGNDSFGSSGSTTAGNAGTASGNFERCKAGARSFGSAKTAGVNGIASGIFKECTADQNSFGGHSVAADANRQCSGTFFNCTGGGASFGRDTGTGITPTARLVRCRKTTGTFGTPQAGAILRWCMEGWTVKANVG